MTDSANIAEPAAFPPEAEVARRRRNILALGLVWGIFVWFPVVYAKESDNWLVVSIGVSLLGIGLLVTSFWSPRNRGTLLILIWAVLIAFFVLGVGSYIFVERDPLGLAVPGVVLGGICLQGAIRGTAYRPENQSLKAIRFIAGTLMLLCLSALVVSPKFHEELQTASFIPADFPEVWQAFSSVASQVMAMLAAALSLMCSVTYRPEFRRLLERAVFFSLGLAVLAKFVLPSIRFMYWGRNDYITLTYFVWEAVRLAARQTAIGLSWVLSGCVAAASITDLLLGDPRKRNRPAANLD